MQLQCFIPLCFLLIGFNILHQSSCQDDYEYPDYEDGACSGALTISDTTSGTIESYDYPISYLNSQNCSWIIQTPENTRIAVKFAEIFSIEVGREGCRDYLFIEYGSITMKICGSGITPSSFITDTNTMNVNFVSDEFNEGAGFSFDWTAIDSSEIPSPVEVTLTEKQGTISSPGFPNQYQNLLKYSWILSQDIGKHILFEFNSEFDMESGTGTRCPYDAINIYEGKSANFDNKLRSICTKQTEPIILKNNEILVEFTSDVSGVGNGFSLNYKTVDAVDCGTPIYVSGPSGRISSPYYPVPYENNLNCIWHISVNEGEKIVVRFDSVFFVKHTTSCTTDFLQIFDGSTTSSVQFQEDFCGEYPPRGFLSSTNELTIVFNSGSLSGDAVGFSLNWTAEAECTSDLFQCWDGICVDKTLKCDGNIDCPNDAADEAECAFSSTADECGKPEIAPDFIWEHRIIGGSQVKQGSWPWQASVTSLEKMVCSGVLISYEWVITAAHCVTKGYNMYVVLGDHNTTDIDVTKEQRIMIDEIYVHPKYNHHNTQGYLEGNDLALLHLSTTANRTEWVQPICLPTNAPTTGKTAVVTGWGRNSYTETELSEILRQVRLPVLPWNQCNKSFSELSPDTILPDTTLCLGFDGSGMGACQGDSGGPAVIRNNSTWEIIGIISFSHQCGAQGRPTYLTSIHSFLPYIQPFIQNGQPTRIERAIIVDAANDGALVFPPSMDESYPKYRQNSFYQWFFSAPVNKKITIRFGDSFNIEFGGEFCPYDYLLIYDGPNTGSRKYLDKRFCGSFPPPNFESSSNSVIIEFSSDNSYEETGFTISWSTDDDCSPDEFRCWNKSCISAAKKCDGLNDCVDGSDEIMCVLAQPGSTECGKAEISPDMPWHPLIVGGSNAVEGSWPWQVAIFESGSNAISCGATLVDEDWVLTAAHCINQSKRYDVILGEFDLGYISLGEKRISVKTLYRNPEFRSPGIDDIALLELSEKAQYSKWIKPICFPPLNDVNPIVGTTCVLTGWGVTVAAPDLSGPQILQQVQLNVLSDADCIDDFKNVVPGYTLNTLPTNLICAGNKNKRANACLRDSGGPLQCLVNGSWQQYGTVSFGSSFVCGEHIFFERVSSYINWIDTILVTSQCQERQVQQGLSGEVQVPVSDEKYPNNFDCSWLLQAPAGMLIEASFEYFDVEAYPTCTFDYVNIHDGDNEKARKVFDETLCGLDKTVRSFESSSNELLLTFKSDGSEGFAGFKLTWKAVASCASGEFRCWDGSCIPGYKQCDGVTDCPKDRDEIECTHINNVGTCGTQFEAPVFLWSPRIIGGSYAVRGSWPWQVYILDGVGAYKCGGSIVNEDWVLTAAHCTFLSSITVGIGGYNLTDQSQDQIIKVSAIHRHPKYVNADIGNGYDIALFKLERSIVFGNYVQPVCLPTLDNVDLISTNDNCIVTGWGITKISGGVSTILRQVRVPIISNEQCEKANGNPFNRDFLFCAGYFDSGGADSCEGDSGGPLVCLKNNNWFQYGIVSYGTDGLHCGRPGEAGFYTTVTYYEDWIRNVTNGTAPVIPPPVTTVIPTTSIPTVINENSTFLNTSDFTPVTTTTSVNATTLDTLTKINTTTVTLSSNTSTPTISTTPVSLDTTSGSNTLNSSTYYIYFSIILIHLIIHCFATFYVFE